MKKITTNFVAGFVGVGLVFGMAGVSSYAAPASKFSATLSSVELLPEGSSITNPVVLSSSIKTANKKELLIGVSLVTGLYTKTKVSSKDGVTDTSEASAKLEVTVKIDGVQVFPGPVVYDERIQTLSATLGGIIRECSDTGTFALVDPDGDGVYACEETLFDTDNDPLTDPVSVPDGKITLQCECTVDPETIDLALRTAGAHHFNFVARNVTSGDHTITVEVSRQTAATHQEGTADATALVGKGSLTVEEVRATNSPDGVIYME